MYLYTKGYQGIGGEEGEGLKGLHDGLFLFHLLS